MPKPKKQKQKLTPAQRRERKRRRQETEIIFINGKQKRVPRAPAIDGIPIDTFIHKNADPIFLHQNELWETLEARTH